MNDFEINDAELRESKATAYALNELAGEEAAEFEQRMERDPALRREVDSVRAAAGALRRELRAEPALGLTAPQRTRIENERESAAQPQLVFRGRTF